MLQNTGSNEVGVGLGRSKSDWLFLSLGCGDNTGDGRGVGVLENSFVGLSQGPTVEDKGGAVLVKSNNCGDAESQSFGSRT